MSGIDVTPVPVVDEHGRHRTDRARADGFRPDLEGLRAVAVVLVLLYHAGLPGFGGGYVGVDIFFVLSGFLITGLIARELHDTGSLDLIAFYARRARRLLPAAALVLLVTVVASAIFLPPLRVPDVAADGAAAALYAANLRFAIQATDYLAAEAAPSPLLHYWSLGVEEQFYLFWPALLLVATRAFGLRVLAPIVFVVAVGSLVLGVYLTGVSAPWAFYSLPTRAWELALGGLVALAAMRGLRLPRVLAFAAAGAGLAMAVAAGLLFDTTTPFPGTAALLPTVGAALLIAAGIGGTVTPVGRMLTLRPMRFLGRISYSLYLWHWPMLVIPAVALGGDLPLVARLGLAALTVPIAALSQRLIEEPIRRGRVVGVRPRPNLAVAGVLTVVVAVASLGLGSLVRVTQASAATPDEIGEDLEDVLGTPMPSGSVVVSAPPVTPGAPTSPKPAASPDQTAGPSASPVPAATPAATTAPVVPTTPPAPVPPDLQPPLAAAKQDIPRVYGESCHVDQGVITSPPCVYGDPASDTTVVLFGDSHAAMWFPALERLAVENGWRLVSLTKALCAAVDHPVWNGGLRREYTECAEWRDAAVERIAAEQADLVVVVNSKFAALAIDGQPVPSREAGAVWDDALARLLVELDATAGSVALIGDTPQMAEDPPVCLSDHLDDALACATPAEEAVPWERLAADARAAAAAEVPFIDPTPWVCPSDPCPVVIGSALVYHDAGHLTRTFADALAPYLGASLPPMPP